MDKDKFISKLQEMVDEKVITPDEKDWIIRGYELGFRYDIHESMESDCNTIAYAYTHIKMSRKYLNGRNEQT